jgi:hypothetical protein
LSVQPTTLHFSVEIFVLSMPVVPGALVSGRDSPPSRHTQASGRENR